jgi:RimJ/RimL family protein N-acetyltransferase
VLNLARCASAARDLQTRWRGPRDTLPFVSNRVELNDGVVELRSRTLGDVEQQIAGQDPEIDAWLGWDPPTVENVSAMITSCMEAEAAGLQRFDLGVYDASTGALVGNCLANFVDPLLADGEVNVAYAIFPAWRHRGIASRAVELLCEWLRSEPSARIAVLKIDSGNYGSLGVARRNGFLHDGSVVSSDATYERWVRSVA